MEGSKIIHRRRCIGLGSLSWLLLSILCALWLRILRGYQPFPSVDDFLYVPMAWRFLDPSLFPRDLFIQEQPTHALAWPALVWVAENTIGLASGFWWAMILLSISTALVVYRLLQSLEVSSCLLPAILVSTIGAHPMLQGLGRGFYGGMFGSGFHAQWLALVFLLWSYAEVVRQRTLSSGVLLGITVVCHPVVGLHGVIVLCSAFLLTRSIKFVQLARIGLACIFTSSPVIFRTMLQLQGEHSSGWSSQELLEKAYLFRTPHEFELGFVTSFEAGVTIAFLVFLSTLGVYILHLIDNRKALGVFSSLWLGQSLLLAAAVLIHGPWQPFHILEKYPTFVYLLNLTRTTPITIFMSVTFVWVTVYTMTFGTRRVSPHHHPRLMMLHYVLASILLFALFVDWQPLLLLLLLLFPITEVLSGNKSYQRIMSLLFGILSLVIIHQCYRTQVKWEVLDDETAGLFEWVNAKTASDALFIVPPGFDKFRLYTRRSIYVDFRSTNYSVARLIPEWRRRLELISHPDKIALKARGWEGIQQWDRTYASRNGSDEIADLLAITGAHYFVYDNKPLSSPPFTPPRSFENTALTEEYRNARFAVYSLAVKDRG